MLTYQEDTPRFPAAKKHLTPPLNVRIKKEATIKCTTKSSYHQQLNKYNRLSIHHIFVENFSYCHSHPSRTHIRLQYTPNHFSFKNHIHKTLSTIYHTLTTIYSTLTTINNHLNYTHIYLAYTHKSQPFCPTLTTIQQTLKTME